MPSKYQITKAAAEVLKTEVFSNEPEYRSFLNTAARNYRFHIGSYVVVDAE